MGVVVERGRKRAGIGGSFGAGVVPRAGGDAADRRRFVSLRAGGDCGEPDGAGTRYEPGFGWGLGVRTLTRDGVVPGATGRILQTTWAAPTGEITRVTLPWESTPANTR